ncbi:hypothetical protein FHL15_007537 [Xylaria flabelliformis]|uniref:MYND-type domain-containing protein n=1 Tax=Xylaria flabelliformis TaxID=2512241 RepID=A0A553HU94_9PEZI|nr:hypothetical protein FHL15_007537 [Xylaria flabelliformis]
MAAQSDQAGLPCSNAIEGSAARGFDAADGVKDFEILKSCTTCGSEAKMRCPSCGTWYCERKCLVKDWSHHQIVCKDVMGEFNSDKAPVNHVRAILFPWDAKTPRWIWIHLKTLDVSITRALGITGKGVLKKAVNKLAVVDINKSLHHRKIGHGIRQFTAPKARVGSGHNVNRSIFALSEPGALKAYFGSALFFAFRTYQADGVTKIFYEDTSPRDLRIIIEWYWTRPENSFIPLRKRLPLKSYCQTEEELFLWPAVKINCTVDLARMIAFSGHDIYPFHPVWILSKDVAQNRTECELPTRAGLPWFVQQCCSLFDPIADKGKEKELLYNHGGLAFAPQAGRRFQRSHLDNSEGWVIEADLSIQYCGSLIISRNDGCIIDAEQVVAFDEFIIECFEKVNALLTYPSVRPGVDRAMVTEDEARRFITREAFEPYWRKYAGVDVGPLARGWPTPYDKVYVAESDTVEEVKKEGVKEEVKEGAKEEVAEEAKEELKEKAKEEVTEEAKEKVKEEVIEEVIEEIIEEVIREAMGEEKEEAEEACSNIEKSVD